MPSVMEYNDAKVDFSKILDYVSGKSGVVTIVRAGKPLARISPVRYYRTTEPDPALSGSINFDLFADESSDWENA